MRERQAEQTRAAVVDAARSLFVDRGYAATSIDDIAATAQVARRTVYAIGGKPELLKLAYDTAIAGDHDEIAMADRPAAARIRDEADPVAALHLYLDMALGIQARVASIHVALRAAVGDERVRELYDHIQDSRAVVSRRVVDALVARGAPITQPATAGDLLWLLNDPGLYHALVHDRGWSEERMAAWLHATAEQQLLDDGAGRAPG
ncbi:TetR family transcriptional regulator [Pseudonocardia sp.]|uniref:TetR/AcrR family transcriptional regulator n=1 Tax=Pseudonocardia sp. TaxID=60912 RepID=UPI002603EC79|nr:TetR family transcriptional regulator [Pseudonocardia sp.]